LKHALEARCRFGTGERRAVVEAHPVAQGERPDEPIARHGPPRGKTGLDIGRTFTVRHESVEDLAGDQRRGALERGRGIERGRHAGHADAQFLPWLGRRVV
jgi:hypothetical protein